MKKYIYTLLLALSILAACQQKSHEKDHGHDAHAEDGIQETENQALYNEVMKIHDEVMPKMEDIHRKKEALKNRIAENASMPEDQKQKIEATIAKLDSAGEGMMVWMRQFNPIPDSAGEEKAREYLETEMEKVKKVREDILQALKQAEN
ncbi:hypothetical protein [Chryseosolibacter indicus]|uniref:Viral A-type inclusion protein n=1 Tax=Chryseosolibacter indicus TaxID=2782351 RepID=A0ABS5VSW5_9BACT|nr:hypothetical protein [Chryseosolibacter indicus]MBT1703864.1 hypothetical protein [Chryseosolibacter indicus]